MCANSINNEEIVLKVESWLKLGRSSAEGRANVKLIVLPELRELTSMILVQCLGRFNINKVFSFIMNDISGVTSWWQSNVYVLVPILGINKAGWCTHGVIWYVHYTKLC